MNINQEWSEATERTARKLGQTAEQCCFEDGMLTYTRCTHPVASLGAYYCKKHARYEPEDAAERVDDNEAVASDHGWVD